MRKWENDTDDWKCPRCMSVKKRGDELFDNFRSWEICDDDDNPMEMCLFCIPVVLRTKLK